MLSYKWGTVLLLTSISMCSAQEQAMFKVAHSNGLQLEIPQTLSVERTTNGFLIEPPNSRQLRSPLRITVNLNAKQELSEEEWDSSKNINGQVVNFRVEKTGVGSGGSIYTLRAWKPFSEGYIALEQTIQIEMYKPDFSLGWTILENADVLTSEK